jgi:hypothetical protein
MLNLCNSTPVRHKCNGYTHQNYNYSLVSRPPRSEYLLAVDFHALLQAVGNGTLTSSRALREGSRAAKGTGGSTVAHTDNADVLGATNLAVAGHALGHLDLYGEVGVGREGETAEAKARDVLCYSSGLEGVGACTAGRGIYGGGKRSSTVLVDLGVFMCVSQKTWLDGVER